MKKLYLFGDSHTAGIYTEGSPKPEEWSHIPYSKYLIDFMKMPAKNMAIPGRNFILNVNDVIKNLDLLERRAGIVLFQTQYFCNSLLKYDNIDLVVTSYLLNKNPKERVKIGNLIKEDNLETLANWTLDFEERRSLYDYQNLIDVFKYLKSKGVMCKILHWIPPYTIQLPDSEFVLFNDEDKSWAMAYDNPITFDVYTNNEWNDTHTIPEWNKKLARKIARELKKEYYSNYSK